MIDDDDAIDGGEDDIAATLSAAYDKQTAEAAEAEPVAEVVETEEPKEAADETQERARDEKGRFAKAEQAETEVAQEEALKKEPEPSAQGDTQTQASFETETSRPPPGWSPASKAAFGKLRSGGDVTLSAYEAKAIVGDVVKREVEVSEGYRRYAGLGEYASEAERNGTNIATVVRDYREVEREIRKDFRGGIEYICHRFGVDPQSLANAILTRYGSGASMQPAGQDQEARQPAPIDPNAIVRMAEERAREAARREFEDRQMVSNIEAFSTDPKNKFFSNVRSEMASLIQTGQAATLQEAYDKACWLNPEVRDVLLNEARATQAQTQSIAQKAAAASQARQATKSITGAPSPGSKPAKAPERSLEDTLRDAWDASAGAV